MQLKVVLGFDQRAVVVITKSAVIVVDVGSMQTFYDLQSFVAGTTGPVQSTVIYVPQTMRN